MWSEPSALEPITIAVVPRDRFSMFPRCLEALYARTTGVPFQIVVVAGGADGETRSYLRRLESERDNLRVTLVDRLLNQGESRNIAMRQADGRFWVFLENDTLVHHDWLSPLLRCMREENAAVVTPLILWHRGIHTAGCMFDEVEEAGATVFRHRILYTEICRKRVDYPENHCILIDRRKLTGDDLFDDVEPFDVDLGLTLRKRGLHAFLEPRAMATYSAPPPWEPRDIPAFRFRWDPKSWEARNRLFMRKWGVIYDPSRKRASYRRQQIKLGLARWYPNRMTVGAANLAVGVANRVFSLVLPAGPQAPVPGRTL